MSAVARAVRGVHWSLKELAGEGAWDRYLQHCAEHGHPPVSRREFERRRADEREANPVTSCC